MFSLNIIAISQLYFKFISKNILPIEFDYLSELSVISKKDSACLKRYFPIQKNVLPLDRTLF
ncbi:hypothetical protein DRW41_07155 [Neobacillus piezotolerans]|uniref:Uncharacterized protein n=1 Tax=Neobacillus piezotolerans TaxID=2259171 RepID=A0A3D8GTF7_9BACI|nr:hypothetical protein DRW41_07155 [Neobacillus piezotolerans]